MSVEAQGVLASIQNQQFAPVAEAVPSLIPIIGTYDPTKTITDNVPALSLSSNATGSKYGWGSMLHRLHLQAERGTGGFIPVWIIPQAEVAGAAAVGAVDFTGSVGVLAGTYYFYIGGDLVRVAVVDADTPLLLGPKLEAAINADTSLNFTAVDTAGVVAITSKTIGVYGNAATGAKFAENRETAQETPTGITTALTQPVSGSGLPDITPALNGMGTGDAKNSQGFTGGIHGYGQDSTTLDAILAYIGPGDQLTGTYQKEVARNFYFATGDHTNQTNFATLLAFGNTRRETDRANVIYPVADSRSHPSEIGAQFVGIVERLADDVAAQAYTGETFLRIDPGDVGERWTDDRANRKLALNAGISSSFVLGSTISIKDTVTLYHPVGVPENSNIYRELANIRKIRNILHNEKVTFTAQGIQKTIIVEDITVIASAKIRSKAIDIDLVRSTQLALITLFAEEGWTYESAFASKELEVALRSATDGFDSVLKLILSGVNKVSDNLILADISTAVLSA